MPLCENERSAEDCRVTSHSTSSCSICWRSISTRYNDWRTCSLSRHASVAAPITYSTEAPCYYKTHTYLTGTRSGIYEKRVKYTLMLRMARLGRREGRMSKGSAAVRATRLTNTSFRRRDVAKPAKLATDGAFRGETKILAESPIRLRDPEDLPAETTDQARHAQQQNFPSHASQLIAGIFEHRLQYTANSGNIV